MVLVQGWKVVKWGVAKDKEPTFSERRAFDLHVYAQSEPVDIAHVVALPRAEPYTLVITNTGTEAIRVKGSSLAKKIRIGETKRVR